MYALTSQASRTRFSDAGILANNVYTTAHTYIVGRCEGILNAMKVTAIQATPSTAIQNAMARSRCRCMSCWSARWPAPSRKTSRSRWSKRAAAWRVSWSPGLILSHLDDPNDPLYSWHVIATPEFGDRGTIYDRDGNVLAKDGMLREIDAVPSQMTAASINALSTALNIPVAQINATLPSPRRQHTPSRVWLLDNDNYPPASAPRSARSRASASRTPWRAASIPTGRTWRPSPATSRSSRPTTSRTTRRTTTTARSKRSGTLASRRGASSISAR